MRMYQKVVKSRTHKATSKINKGKTRRIARRKKRK